MGEGICEKLEGEDEYVKAILAPWGATAIYTTSAHGRQAMRIDEIRERVEKATKGPWESPLKDLGRIDSFKEIDFYFDHSFEAYPPLGEAGPIFVAATKEDADFLTHSREDIPYLLARIKELEGKLADATVTMQTIAAYGVDGICPYGCDTPNIAANWLLRAKEESHD